MEKFKKIDKPDYKKYEPSQLAERLVSLDDALLKPIFKTEVPEYLYWSKIKKKTWLPDDMAAEKFWAYVRFYRQFRSLRTAICDQEGNYFRWIKL
ncbi:MAG: hypothetical protein COB49_06305, partial [Alphaproteobacteria bacterium]